jgi:hypothetical protein
MWERKLRRGVNFQGTLQQKGVKQGQRVHSAVIVAAEEY